MQNADDHQRLVELSAEHERLVAGLERQSRWQRRALLSENHRELDRVIDGVAGMISGLLRVQHEIDDRLCRGATPETERAKVTKALWQRRERLQQIMAANEQDLRLLSVKRATIVESLRLSQQVSAAVSAYGRIAKADRFDILGGETA